MSDEVQVGERKRTTDEMSKLGIFTIPGGVQEEPVVQMLREKFKWRTHENESTDAEHRGGPTCSSAEVSIMEMERRGWIIWA